VSDGIDAEQRLKEGYYQHGSVLCDGCDQRVDLSDAEDITDAAELWNQHLESEHGGEQA